MPFFGPFSDPDEVIDAPVDPNLPIVLQGQIGTSGDRITLAFNKPVIDVFATSFVLSGGHLLSDVSGSGATRTMKIDPPVIQGEVPTLAYVGASVKSGEYAMLPFSGKAVVNTSQIASLGNPVWKGIVERIRSRVQDTALGVSDAYFDKDIELELQTRLGPYGIAYGDLTDPDKLLVNTVVGFTVAAKLSVPLQTGGLNAPVVYRNITTAENAKVTMSTAQISAGKGIDERDNWTAEAEEKWAMVSFVKAGRKKIPATSLFGLAGRRRGLDRARRY